MSMHHPTAEPDNPVNTVYAVIDKRDTDSYKNKTVAMFNSRTAAERFKDRAERKNGSFEALSRYFVSEKEVFSAPNAAADRL